MTTRFLLEPLKTIAGLLLLWVCFSQFADAERFEVYQKMNRFDAYFRKYSEKYFGTAFDWRYFKAQAVAESRLKKKARSRDGAIGLMQILPATFEEIQEDNPAIADRPWQPRWNIAAAISYNRMLWETFEAERSFEERLRFMFGAYNAGKQAILAAQQVAIETGLNPYKWSSIEQTLPAVLGGGSRETIGYVRDVFMIRKNLTRR